MAQEIEKKTKTENAPAAAAEQRRRARFVREMVNGLAPTDATQRSLAETVAEDYWQLEGLRAMETEILSRGWKEEFKEIPQAGTLLAAFNFQRYHKELNALSLTEARVAKRADQNLRLFTRIQDARSREVSSKAKASKVIEIPLRHPVRDKFRRNRETEPTAA